MRAAGGATSPPSLQPTSQDPQQGRPPAAAGRSAPHPDNAGTQVGRLV